jgi:hypothetical protein
MTSRAACASTERLAGAIAIGEASDADRQIYRAHLSSCRTCLLEFGGEREIERIMSVVERAREDERWEPALRLTPGRTSTRRSLWFLAGALAAALVLVVGVRTLERSGPAVPTVQAISATEARALAALDTQTVPKREARAESLAVGAATFSTALEVTVDAHGRPVRCRISTSSGDRAFDQSICRAALRARYKP